MVTDAVMADMLAASNFEEDDDDDLIANFDLPVDQDPHAPLGLGSGLNKRRRVGDATAAPGEAPTAAAAVLEAQGGAEPGAQPPAGIKEADLTCAVLATFDPVVLLGPAFGALSMLLAADCGGLWQYAMSQLLVVASGVLGPGVTVNPGPRTPKWCAKVLLWIALVVPPGGGAFASPPPRSAAASIGLPLC